MVEELADRFGRLKKGWPKKLLRSLEERNAALVAAICERVCFVPKASRSLWPPRPLHRATSPLDHASPCQTHACCCCCCCPNSALLSSKQTFDP